MLKKIIRAYALRLKEDCEAWNSPVPRPIKSWLHGLGKRLYCATYGLTPQQVSDALSGVEMSTVQIVNANICRRNYGSTLNPDGTIRVEMCIAERALLVMLAYNEFNGDWQHMLSICGIHIEEMSDLEDSRDTAERYELPRGTYFYYVEPNEDEEEED